MVLSNNALFWAIRKQIKYEEAGDCRNENISGIFITFQKYFLEDRVV